MPFVSLSLSADACLSILQAAAAAQIAASHINIFDAAKQGHLHFVQAHVTVDPACVHKEDMSFHGACDSRPRMLILKMQLCFHSFHPFFRFSSNTPLHWSSLNGHLDVCEFLVASKADVNVINRA